MSLTQQQYNELCEALNYATCFPLDKEIIDSSLKQANKHVENVCNTKCTNEFVSLDTYVNTYVTFSVPMLMVDLRNEHNVPLIQISFQEFNFRNHNTATEQELEIRLRSILMEDLKCQRDSKLRNMVNSSDKNLNRNKFFINNNISLSCPNLSQITQNVIFKSVPSNLNANFYENCHTRDDIDVSLRKNLKSSDTNDNLVIYKSILTKQSKDSLNLNLLQNSIDFNCLDLVISNEKWFMIFDFLGLISHHQKQDEGEIIKENYNCKIIYLI